MLRTIQVSMIIIILIAVIASRMETKLPTYMEGYITEKRVETISLNDNFSNRKISMRVYYILIQKDKNHDQRRWYINDYTYYKSKVGDYIKVTDENLHTAWEQ